MVTEYTLPPHNIEAEKWVISWALMDNETVWIFEWDGITAKDFYQREHWMIYEAIAQLWNEKKTIDVVTVSDQLSKNWNLEAIWWIDYLYELSAFLISTSPCVEYSKIVKEKSILFVGMLGNIYFCVVVRVVNGQLNAQEKVIVECAKEALSLMIFIRNYEISIVSGAFWCVKSPEMWR